MTTTEFDTELDIIYENINKNGAPGLDPYEKSVILSHAQEALIKAVIAVEESEDKFPALIKVATFTTPTTNGFDGGYVFDRPTSELKILNESVNDGTNTYIVLPISSTQFQQKRAKAYRYPPRRRAWRLVLEEGGDESSEIFSRSGVVLTSYKVRYIKKPTPIILANLAALTPAASIDGLTAITQCELDAGTHRDILRIATTLAEQYYMDKYGTNGDQ